MLIIDFKLSHVAGLHHCNILFAFVSAVVVVANELASRDISA